MTHATSEMYRAEIRIDSSAALMASRALQRGADPTLSIRIPVTVTTPRARLSTAVIEQLVCKETVTLVGPGGRLRKIPVIGCPGKVNQIEISHRDARLLGLRVPVRESGDLRGSPGVTLEGQRSQFTIGTGVICAMRQVRMNLAQAQRLGLKDRDRVEVSAHGPDRSLCFRDVLVRIAADDSLGFYLDADEADAAGVSTGDFVELIGSYAYTERTRDISALD